MEYQLYKNTGQKEYFSPDFIYTERENKGKQGMSFYNALSIAKYSGNVAEFRFPYQPKDITSVPDSVVQEASSYKITDFDRLDSITELKQALVNNGVCMVLFPIYHPAEAMFWLKKEHADQPVAYHGLAIVGYNDNKSQFKIRNSWGNKWNGDGYTYWNYKDYSSARELWTLTSTNGNRLPQQPVDKGNKCKCVLL
jgi:C1A family cysteine protease